MFLNNLIIILEFFSLSARLKDFISSFYKKILRLVFLEMFLKYFKSFVVYF